jgi:hypothetical protein
MVDMTGLRARARDQPDDEVNMSSAAADLSVE